MVALLSWTLTPNPDVDTVLEVTATPNRNLAAGIKYFVENTHDQIVNLVYVDYVESARVTDVCVYLNGVPQPPA